MPGLNRKGPNGEGAMSGRKMGQCSPENKGKSAEEITSSRMAAVQENDSMTRGMGRGRGLGRGMGFGARGGQGRGMGARFGMK